MPSKEYPNSFDWCTACKRTGFREWKPFNVFPFFRQSVLINLGLILLLACVSGCQSPDYEPGVVEFMAEHYGITNEESRRLIEAIDEALRKAAETELYPEEKKDE